MKDNYAMKNKVTDIHPLIRVVAVLILIKLVILLFSGPEGPKSSLYINPHAFDSVAEDCTTFDPDTGEEGKIDLDCAERAIYH
jgi:hypothetical protein